MTNHVKVAADRAASNNKKFLPLLEELDWINSEVPDKQRRYFDSDISTDLF